MEISENEVWKTIEESELAKPHVIGDIDLSLMTIQEIELVNTLRDRFRGAQ